MGTTCMFHASVYTCAHFFIRRTLTLRSLYVRRCGIFFHGSVCVYSTFHIFRPHAPRARGHVHMPFYEKNVPQKAKKNWTGHGQYATTLCPNTTCKRAQGTWQVVNYVEETHKKMPPGGPTTSAGIESTFSIFDFQFFFVNFRFSD